MSMSVKNLTGNPHPAVDAGVMMEKKRTDEEIVNEICHQFVKRTDKSIQQTQELLERASDARAAMDVLAETWKASWLEFQESCDTRLRDLRMYRMANESEVRQLMVSLREVRSFFMDKDYATEVARLREFVELCERLQKLKESGFLDKVADTMLRLAP